MATTDSSNHPPTLDPQAAALWEKLRRFPFDRGTGPQTFASRLASEQGWSASFTTFAIGEYRRFLLLFTLGQREHAAAEPSGAPPRVRIVPSAVVDKVWHLHLLYTQSYWETLCRDILGGPLHHLPADGSASEAPVLDTVYADTLKCYRRIFGHDAPESVWPPAKPPGAPAGARRPDQPRDLESNPGPQLVMAALFCFAVFLLFQNMVPAGLFLLAMLLLVAAIARGPAARGATWFGRNTDGSASFICGGSSSDEGSPTHHDSGHHGGGHDAGGHSHSCGGGHSCGGHGCGGHGCGGH